MFLQLVNYLNLNHLIHPNHHGSRQGHSTATALLQMYDQWIEDVEDDKMVGVMMVDLSAAFDMVDHPLLLQKLELFGLEPSVLSWIKSYLSNRTQSVFVDGCLSPPLRLECGVPQGSILGPLFYILYTNDIPDLVHNHPVNHLQPEPSCDPCGGTVCYVDDATYSVGHSDPAVLSSTLSEQYSTIAEYMAANKLVINGDKTHLVVMATKKFDQCRAEVQLQAGQHIILPSSSEKLLGCNISQDMKWKVHISGSDQSMYRHLTSRINGLCMISSRACFSTRLMVANGIVMSKLCYLIQLWGGCEGYLLHGLQVIQNRAARAVTRCSWWTPTRRLLAACNWLSVKQLVMYQSLVMTHKVIISGSPFYLKENFNTVHSYRTRQASTGSIRRGPEPSKPHNFTFNSFTYRATREYNLLPGQIRSSRTMSSFKTKLKEWIKTNVPID